jgi:hypothetical protein
MHRFRSWTLDPPEWRTQRNRVLNIEGEAILNGPVAYGSSLAARFLQNVKNGTDSVDIMVIGDSNAGSGNYGYSGGLFYAANYHFNGNQYATNLNLTSTNTGLSLTSNTAIINDNHINHAVNTGNISNLITNTSTEAVGLESYLGFSLSGTANNRASVKPIGFEWDGQFVSSGLTYSSPANSNVIYMRYEKENTTTHVNFTSLINASNNFGGKRCQYRLVYGTFPTGSGSFRLRAMRPFPNQSTLLGSTAVISTNTGAYGYATAACDFTTYETPETVACSFDGWNQGGTWPITGPFCSLWHSVIQYRKGFAVNNFIYDGGKSTALLATIIENSGKLLESYLKELRERQIQAGGSGKVIIWNNTGINGSDTAETWVTNNNRIVNHIQSVWLSLGYPLKDLAFLLSFTHPTVSISIDGSTTYVSNNRASIVADLQKYSKDNVTYIELANVLSGANLVTNSYYANTTTEQAHLNPTGYMAMCRGVLHSLLTTELYNGECLSLDFTDSLSHSAIFFNRTSIGTTVNKDGYVAYPETNFSVISAGPAVPSGGGISLWGCPTNSVSAIADRNNIANKARRLTITQAGSTQASFGFTPTSANFASATATFWIKGQSNSNLLTIGMLGSDTWGNNIANAGICEIIEGYNTGVNISIRGGNPNLWDITGLSTTQWTKLRVTRKDGVASLNLYPGGVTATGQVHVFDVSDFQVNPGVAIQNLKETTTAAYHGPRFIHEPSTQNPQGLLIEGPNSNLLCWSEEFRTSGGTTNWQTSGSAVDNAITANVLSPENRLSGVKLKQDTSTGLHSILQLVTSEANQVYTFSVFVKAAGINFIRIMDNGGSSASSYVNVSNGTVVSSSNTGHIAIIPYKNNWYRVSQTIVTAVGQTTINAQIRLSVDGTTDSYTGANLTDGVFLWGAQVEKGLGASSYIPTVNTSTTRNADLVKISANHANLNQFTAQIPDSTYIIKTTRFQQGFTTNANTTAYPQLWFLFTNAANSIGSVYGYSTTLSAGTATYYSNTGLRTVAVYDPNLTIGLSYSGIGSASDIQRSSINGSTGPSSTFDVVTHTAARTLYLGPYSYTADTTAGNNLGSLAVHKMKIYPFSMPQAQLNARTSEMV